VIYVPNVIRLAEPVRPVPAGEPASAEVGEPTSAEVGEPTSAEVGEPAAAAGEPAAAEVGEAGAPPRLRLATLGRIMPQKGPEYFRRLVLLGRELDLPLCWIWVGGGEPAAEQALREAGVLVTGWSSRSAALGWLATADVYVHTAAWEGAPVSVLEAAALGLPIVARRSPSLAALGMPSLFDSPEALIEAVRSLLDERRRAELRAHSEVLLRQHRPEAQRMALQRAYAAALGPAAARRRFRAGR
jgi:glycosyltransferase involved in cell wall biosynthesis